MDLIGRAVWSGKVESHNEWDPLEEVIVGDVAGAMRPAWNVINQETLPSFAIDAMAAMAATAGTPFESGTIEAATRALTRFVALLESEGVQVRRPDVLHHSSPYATPGWSVANGYCAANPRDVFLVVGNEIIEAAMPDRGRQFEAWPYRRLLTEYFRNGARWSAAPKPRLLDELYQTVELSVETGPPLRYVTSECEPVFDAADFVRCGRDIIAQRSHVTNELGIAWLERHLGPEFRVHRVNTRCREPMHIDTTLMPLAPGKLLINPEFLDPRQIPHAFRNWDVLEAPRLVARFAAERGRAVVSDWMSMNVLMLDETRVVVEASQEPLIQALRRWGFCPLLCAFEDFYPFAGSFHCATLDVRRRGCLESYTC